MSLRTYRAKRDFTQSREPTGKKRVKPSQDPIFVVQKHHARNLHYDFRLESEGALKSWAVPKGPSMVPGEKRLAVEVEDHPIEYAHFEGDIPAGNYGAGHVDIWDRGTWSPQGSVRAGLKKGHLDFELFGDRLSGHWTLIRTRKGSGRQNSWLLIKRSDTRDIANQVKKRPASSQKSPPAFVDPQLARLVSTVPQGNEWIHEIKFDGYRSLLHIQNGKVKILTRRGLDWTKKYRPVAEAAKAFPVRNALVDGEMVWIDGRGHSSFSGLQEALSSGNTERLLYYAFDLLYLDGQDLRELPLVERKRALKALVDKLGDSKILYSEHSEAGARKLFLQMCRHKMEGVVSKRKDAPYISGRGDNWQKTKCSLRQEFVIVGYAESSVASRGLKSILTAVHDDGSLRYTGRVGTGFTGQVVQDLLSKLKKLKIKSSVLDEVIPEKGIRWVKPQLIAEVEFKEWTAEGLIRQGSFQGLREDKDPQNIRRDDPVEELRITHPERIVYPRTKTRKIDVFHYYDHIFPRLQPFLWDRPLSILRCQTVSGKDCFFQKHSAQLSDSVRSKPVHYMDKKGYALVAESKPEVLQLIQAGALELHAWGARFKSITQPDLMVFDLDPDTDRLWSRVVETALEIREMLKKLGLQSFVKVTGGKGLHVHVPLEPQYEWATIKQFSKSLMQVLIDAEPDHYTINSRKTEREGKIFLDYLRNGYGATAILPYSLRARARPSLAMPISWAELKRGILPDEFELHELGKILKGRRDPWAGYFDLKQKIDILKAK